MLDHICFKFYGKHGMEPLVLESNHGLADRDPVYPKGLLIELPDVPTTETKATVRLWD